MKKRIDEIWEKAEKQVIYTTILLFVLLEFTSVFIKQVETFMDSHGSLLLIGLILLFIFRYLDKNIQLSKNSQLKSIKRFTTDVTLLFEDKKYRKVRIFANSSYKYYNAIAESNCTIKELQILIRDFTDTENIQFPSSDEGRNLFAQTSINLINNWKELERKGRVKKLEIKLYPFDSILHYMIIENSILHFGLLNPKHEFPGSDLNGSFVVSDSHSDGKLLVQSYIDEFETIRNNFSEKVEDITHLAI